MLHLCRDIWDHSLTCLTKFCFKCTNFISLNVIYLPVLQIQPASIESFISIISARSRESANQNLMQLLLLSSQTADKDVIGKLQSS